MLIEKQNLKVQNYPNGLLNEFFYVKTIINIFLF